MPATLLLFTLHLLGLHLVLIELINAKIRVPDLVSSSNVHLNLQAFGEHDALLKTRWSVTWWRTLASKQDTHVRYMG